MKYIVKKPFRLWGKLHKVGDVITLTQEEFIFFGKYVNKYKPEKKGGNNGNKNK